MTDYPKSQHYRIEMKVSRGPVLTDRRRKNIEWGYPVIATLVVDGGLLSLRGPNGSKEQEQYIGSEILVFWKDIFAQFYPMPPNELLLNHMKEKGFTPEDVKIGLNGLKIGKETPVVTACKEFIADWKARMP